MEITGIEPEIKGRYGLHQLVLKYQRITSLDWDTTHDVTKYEADRFVAQVNVNLSKMDRFENFKFSKRFNVDLKYNITIRKLFSKSTSLFAMVGYKGQDDYNIYLEDDFWYIGFGISAGNSYYELKK